MYKVGDLIVYGNTGVCKVLDIKTLDSPSVAKDQLYYILKPLFSDCMISTPIDNTRVFMRPVIPKDEAERLIDMIPTIEPTAYPNQELRQLSAHYEASLVTHDCADLIALTMSIYKKKLFAEKQNRKLGQIDEKYMKRAEDLLFGEFSVALGIPKNNVQDYITSRVGDIKQSI